MMGTVGAPTLIDLCCSESTEVTEMACCGGLDTEETDDDCCDTELTFDSIDGQSHKAESQKVDTPTEFVAEVTPHIVMNVDEGLAFAPRRTSASPPTSPTQSFLGVYRL